MKEELIGRILTEKVIAIVRLDEAPQVAPAIAALIDAGIKVLEITSNTPGYLGAIQAARQRYPDVAIGAGTVVNAAIAAEAIAYGAQFLVTPNMNTEVIAVAHQAGVPAVMGAMTPTEVAVGVASGADFIKLFPAATLGVDYFKALLGPFRGVRFLAVGGVNRSNAPEWFAAGVSGIGVGGSIMGGDAADVSREVHELLRSVHP